MDVDTGRFYQELTAVGLNIAGCDSSGNVSLTSPDTNGLAPLVLAAHGLPLASAQGLALQAVVTTAQWTAYQNARNVTIQQQRADAFEQQTDPMRLKLDEDFVPGTDGWNAGLAAWKAAKAAIRAELPYPE